jgi:hypothetical protein
MALNSGGSGGASSGGVRAGRAFVELGVKDSLTGQLKDIERKFNKAGSALMKGGGMLSVGALASIPLLGAAANELGEIANLGNTAKALGLTAEAASSLFGVLQHVGGDLKENIEGVTQFGQVLSEAFNGGGGNADKLFEGLSISAKDLMNLPLDEQFYRILGAIRQLPQEQQAFRLGLIGGTDSMKKWLPLLSMTEEQIRATAKSYEMSAADIEEATKANVEYRAATASLARLWQQVAIGLAPLVSILASGFRMILGPMIEWAKQNKVLATVIVGSALAIGSLGIAFVALGMAVNLASVAMVAFEAVSGVVMSPIAIAAVAVAALTAGLAALAYWWITSTESGKEFAQTVGKYFSEFLGTVKDVFGGVQNALKTGDTETAWKIVLEGMKVEFWRFINATIGQIGSTLFESAMDGWHKAIFQMKKGWNDLFNGGRGNDQAARDRDNAIAMSRVAGQAILGGLGLRQMEEAKERLAELIGKANIEAVKKAGGGGTGLPSVAGGASPMGMFGGGNFMAQAFGSQTRNQAIDLQKQVVMELKEVNRELKNRPGLQFAN